MHPTWLPFLPYLDALRAALPGTPVIVGGYQAIFSSKATLTHPAVDYICVGDGEMPLVKLVQRLQRGDDSNSRTTSAAISGLWEKQASGQILKTVPVLTENLAEMPFLDYTIFERQGDLRWLSAHAIESAELTTLPVMS